MSAIWDLRQPLRALRSIVQRSRATENIAPGPRSLASRLVDVFFRTWDLGLTAFGGPAVHFTILYGRFVVGGSGKGEKWIDEQTVRISLASRYYCLINKCPQYQELFAICQALPGPASTKMLFCITMVGDHLLTQCNRTPQCPPSAIATTQHTIN
jgi:hypothetical protein